MTQRIEAKPKIAKLRHAEYYGQENLHDSLYADSKEGKIFSNLMPLILNDNNIILAYRNIKANTGSVTPGTDNLTIKSIEKLTSEQVCAEVQRRLSNYRPKKVRRKEIPKSNGKFRPLGIPCIWDRLIQQCILQIMEPICEARFSENSYGFRPLRSTEHAIAKAVHLASLSKLHYVVEVDIKGFFDNVNHTKLMKQLWTMGFRDKKLLCVLKAILKAPILMTDGTTLYPTNGTPQGGLISPLLANIVLNELDRWIEGQWTDMPVTQNYKQRVHKNGAVNNGHAYRAMKTTGLKEMFIVRYADDFRIFCRTKDAAEKTMYAVKTYLEKRLKLEVSEEKTRIINLRKQSSEFLGFTMKLQQKGKKWVIQSHMRDWLTSTPPTAERWCIRI